MSISAVNPILSPVAIQGVSGGVERDLVLQPGTVIDAKVLQVLANNMVRIAIANLSLDVMSQVPLQAGQALQLAVSQTEERYQARDGRAGCCCGRHDRRHRHPGARGACRCGGPSPGNFGAAEEREMY